MKKIDKAEEIKTNCNGCYENVFVESEISTNRKLLNDLIDNQNEMIEKLGEKPKNK